MLTAGVVLLYGNARPHTVQRTPAVLTEFGWELFDPSYSSDHATSDFNVFWYLKKVLSSGDYDHIYVITSGNAVSYVRLHFPGPEARDHTGVV
ncbi:hypothetical protein TNCV_2970201 [Trichonephila clavipes]|nr:hypothetical protein TNCV_2970201 [Trichonephila clavipes]